MQPTPVQQLGNPLQLDRQSLQAGVPAPLPPYPVQKYSPSVVEDSIQRKPDGHSLSLPAVRHTIVQPNPLSIQPSPHPRVVRTVSVTSQ